MSSLFHSGSVYSDTKSIDIFEDNGLIREASVITRAGLGTRAPELELETQMATLRGAIAKYDSDLGVALICRCSLAVRLKTLTEQANDPNRYRREHDNRRPPQPTPSSSSAPQDVEMKSLPPVVLPSNSQGVKKEAKEPTLRASEKASSKAKGKTAATPKAKEKEAPKAPAAPQKAKTAPPSKAKPHEPTPSPSKPVTRANSNPEGSKKKGKGKKAAKPVEEEEEGLVVEVTDNDVEMDEANAGEGSGANQEVEVEPEEDDDEVSFTPSGSE